MSLNTVRVILISAVLLCSNGDGDALGAGAIGGRRGRRPSRWRNLAREACSVSFTKAVSDTSPVVQITNGPIKGISYTSSWTSQTIYAFRGIPFAQPPTGNLRFMPPEPPSNWTSTLDCSAYQNSCMQNMADHEFTLSEDCLYLNVYTPEISLTGSTYPVMVSIHGGAYMIGSGNDFEPDWLLEHGVVVVKANYRLGPLGFLTMGTTTAPGNQGMKDQVMALKWVQSEISKFGGDPNRVTIFGCSAGAQSVHLQYISPLSKGLFHRCIAESGTSLVNSVRADGKSYALQLAELVGCSNSNETAVESCLRTVDATNLTDVGDNMNTPIQDNTIADTLIWRANIDVNTSSEPFMPAWPIELFRQGEGSKVPFIMGTNRDEGVLRLMTGATDEIVQNLTNNLEYLIPDFVRARNTAAEVTSLADEVYQFYMNSTQPSYSNLRDYINLYTDLYFAYGTSVSARMFRQRNPVYVYLFTFDGTFAGAGKFSDELKYNLSLVEHGEQLGYLWISSDINYTDTTANDMITVRRMTKMWTNFAKYGTPTVDVETVSDLQGITWLPIDNTTTRYMHIDINLTMTDSEYIGSHRDLWDSILATTSGAYRLHASGILIVAAAVLWFS